MRNSESNPDDFGAFGILPYYAQVHLRAIGPKLFTDKEETLQTDFHSSQINDVFQGKDSRQKFGSRSTNGLRNIQRTLDTVYELHNFSEEVNSSNDLQSDSEINDELVSGAAYVNMSGVVQSLYPVATPVAQIQYQAYEESQSTGSISFQPDIELQNEMISKNTVSRKTANQKEQIPKNSYEDLQQPSAYAYFHDSDNLSDMAEAVSELTDTAASGQTTSVVKNSSKQMDNGAAAVYSAPRSEVRQVFEIFEKSSVEEERQAFEGSNEVSPSGNFNFAARNGAKENKDESSKFSVRVCLKVRFH